MKLLRKLFSKSKSEKEDIAGKSGIVGGIGVLSTVNRDKLTGIEHRYHNTEVKNIESIKKEGIRSRYSTDPNNLTNTVLRDVDMSKKRGKVYIAKDKSVANKVKLGRLINKGVKSKTINVNIPYEDYKKLIFTDNPELKGMGKKEWIEDRIRFIKNQPKGELNIKLMGGEKLSRIQLGKMYEALSKGTEVIYGDIDSKFIKGGKGYKSQGLKGFAKYVKNNKARFGKQAAKGLLGTGLIAGGAYLVNNSRKSKNKNTKKNDNK